MKLASLFSRSTVLLVLLSLLSGAASGGFTTWLLFHEQKEVPTAPVINAEAVSAPIKEGSYQAVYQKASPAVVSVVALKDLSQIQQKMPFSFGPFSFFGGMPMQEPQTQTPDSNSKSDDKSALTQVAGGTGFIYTADGLVVTNKHVVSDSSAQYAVILDDGTQLDAKVLAQDTLNDIALLQITGKDERLGKLPHLDFADSSKLNVGDPVVAIGNALGEYSNTMTVGILSATDRQIVASGAGFGSENLVNLLQTDAAINPGNSGGPLLNSSGEVIGMNTAIDSTAQGIGFAIPANDIASVVKSYQENGHIVRPYLGVSSVPVTPRLEKHFSLSVDHGAYIIGDAESGPGVVADSPAEKAGLRDGDVIISVDGKTLDEHYNLQNAVAMHNVGDEITLEVSRKDKTLTLKVKLAERKEE